MVRNILVFKTSHIYHLYNILFYIHINNPWKKNITRTLLKLKTSVLWKTMLGDQETMPETCRKYFEHISDKGLVSNIYKKNPKTQ